ncbi:MAG: thioredoxin domain-containing protein [Dehalococcoidia bacterium]|nr:thioredoxin domain-containing protein [Dehalococcoidia bacterium]
MLPLRRLRRVDGAGPCRTVRRGRRRVVRIPSLPGARAGLRAGREAAECAAAQDRFWDYHDILFQRQGGSGAFSDDNLRDSAREVAAHFAAFDVEAFDACLASDEAGAAVQAMLEEGRGLGVEATPTFFVNGALIRDNQPLEVFQQAIDQARGGG